MFLKDSFFSPQIIKEQNQKIQTFSILKKKKKSKANSSCIFLRKVVAGRASQGHMPTNKQKQAFIFWINITVNKLGELQAPHKNETIHPSHRRVPQAELNVS